jgi:hypothetical protein
MDPATAREIAAALVLFGAAGTAAMTIYQLAVKSTDTGLLPTSLACRVHWWRGHLAAVRGVSGFVLLLGVIGLIVL